QPLEDFNEGY
ncbi:unnamed protein product, partial [Allacma fusca]